MTDWHSWVAFTIACFAFSVLILARCGGMVHSEVKSTSRMSYCSASSQQNPILYKDMPSYRKRQ